MIVVVEEELFINLPSFGFLRMRLIYVRPGIIVFRILHRFKYSELFIKFLTARPTKNIPKAAIGLMPAAEISCLVFIQDSLSKRVLWDTCEISWSVFFLRYLTIILTCNFFGFSRAFKKLNNVLLSSEAYSGKYVWLYLYSSWLIYVVSVINKSIILMSFVHRLHCPWKQSC